MRLRLVTFETFPRFARRDLCGVKFGGVLVALLLSGVLGPVLACAQVVVPLSAQEWETIDSKKSQKLLDRAHRGMHSMVWRTARTVDSWAGPPHEPVVYQEASGSIAAAILWDEYNGFDVKVRFRVDMPLPQINERLHLFIGRVNREEFVTERDEPSGAFPDWRSGVTEEDQTLAGLIYTRPERHGFSYSVSGGAQINSGDLDPYVKTSVRYRRVLWGDSLFTVKETVFYQASEEFGLTTRVDFERMLGELWRVGWTGSVTVSEGTRGVRGFSNATATRAFSDRRAIVFRASVRGDSAREVPVREYGVKVAYRQSVLRDWLVLELRTGVMWPRELRSETRKPSWGFGVGCEMYFGSHEFTSRPITF